MKFFIDNEIVFVICHTMRLISIVENCFFQAFLTLLVRLQHLKSQTLEECMIEMCLEKAEMPWRPERGERTERNRRRERMTPLPSCK